MLSETVEWTFHFICMCGNKFMNTLLCALLLMYTLSYALLLMYIIKNSLLVHGWSILAKKKTCFIKKKWVIWQIQEKFKLQSTHRSIWNKLITMTTQTTKVIWPWPSIPTAQFYHMVSQTREIISSAEILTVLLYNTF